ncbi:MAG: 2-succinylbenzoate--CoA ligase [Chlamydiae bacterium]|nr:2-succinylbenzoate--CoA ligase [Chlamydiota bacterium]
MKMLKCQLYNNALNYPNQSFIAGAQTFTYLEFETYTQQIQAQLSVYSPGQVIASSCKNPSFFIALLIAAMRQKLIVFPINFRLPPEEIDKRVLEVNAVGIFEKAIALDAMFKPSFEVAPTYSQRAPATYLMTSGSSQSPKICVHSIENHYCNARASNEVLNFSQGDGWLLSLPLFHVSGISLIFRSLLAKATLILPSNDTSHDLLTQKITHLSCVNAQLQKLLDNPKLLKPLKVILLGGSAPSLELVNKSKDLGLALHVTYGLTEMASQVATSEQRGLELQILNCANVQIDFNSQILVRGPALFLGYLFDGKVLSSTNKDGWFETGDIGELNTKYLSVIGRRDNLFISGGENIQPEEIEALLQEYPDITEAIVVAKPHPKFGHIPAAFIKAKENFNAGSLKKFLESKLPKYKIPKLYLPLNYKTLKPCRKLLKKLVES